MDSPQEPRPLRHRTDGRKNEPGPAEETVARFGKALDECAFDPSADYATKEMLAYYSGALSAYKSAREAAHDRSDVETALARLEEGWMALGSLRTLLEGRRADTPPPASPAPDRHRVLPAPPVRPPVKAPAPPVSRKPGMGLRLSIYLHAFLDEPWSLLLLLLTTASFSLFPMMNFFALDICEGASSCESTESITVGWIGVILFFGSPWMGIGWLFLPKPYSKFPMVVTALLGLLLGGVLAQLSVTATAP